MNIQSSHDLGGSCSICVALHYAKGCFMTLQRHASVLLWCDDVKITEFRPSYTWSNVSAGQQSVGWRDNRAPVEDRKPGHSVSAPSNDPKIWTRTSCCASHLEEFLWCIILIKFVEMCDMDTDRQLRWWKLEGHRGWETMAIKQKETERV